MVILYLILGYWAAGQTVYANKIRLGTPMSLFSSRLFTGALLGIVIIPLAILKLIFVRK